SGRSRKRHRFLFPCQGRFRFTPLPVQSPRRRSSALSFSDHRVHRLRGSCGPRIPREDFSLMTNSIGSLLALAVTTSIALANGGGGGDDDKKNPYQDKGGWQPGSGITLAENDEIRLKILDNIAIQWVCNDNR